MPLGLTERGLSAWPQHVEGVAIVGGSGAGKTTLLLAAKSSHLQTEGLVDAVDRYVTRQPRPSDAATGERPVPVGDFLTMQARGLFALSWARPMENGRFEYYGCLRPKVGALPVYSAGSGIYENAASVRPAGTFERLLVVGVYAPDEIRGTRLAARSPEIGARRPRELAFRLVFDTERMTGASHVVVSNHSNFEAGAPEAFVRFLETLTGAS